jgi:serine protease Do
VITAVNAKKVNDPRELRLMIGSMAPGTKTHIEVNREGQSKTFDVQLGEMPASATEEGTETSSEEPAQPEKTTVFGGVAVTNITDDIRTTLNLPRRFKEG